MSAMASQITSLTIVYSSVYLGADQRKHQSFASLGFARGIHRWSVISQHKGPVMREMFPFDDVIMDNDNIDYITDTNYHSCKVKNTSFFFFIKNLKILHCISGLSMPWHYQMTHNPHQFYIVSHFYIVSTEYWRLLLSLVYLCPLTLQTDTQSTPG